MRLLYQGTQNELTKILGRKKYKVLLIIQSVICAATMLLTTKSGFFRVGIDYPNSPYTILEALLGIVLPLIGFMLMADLFSHEFEDGSIKAVLLRPISRTQIFTCKVLGSTLYLLLNLMIMALIVIIFRIALKGTLLGLITILGSYAVSILPMFALLTLSAFIAQLINNSSMAMFVSLIVYVALRVVGLLSTKIGAVFFTSHLNFYKMCMGNIGAMSILNICLLILSYAALLFIGGFLIFERKEV